MVKIETDFDTLSTKLYMSISITKVLKTLYLYLHS